MDREYIAQARPQTIIEEQSENGAQMVVRCPLCGKARRATLRHIAKTGHTYCRGCAHVYDLMGQRFGRLTAVRYARGNGKPRWVCRCSCGNAVEVTAHDLLTGHTVSCGCHKQDMARQRAGKNHPRFLDLTKQQFGRLTVEEYVGDSAWLCRCECGEEVLVQSGNLTNGGTESCGCLWREVMAARSGENSATWDPSLTDEDRAGRRLSPKYEAWRVAVFVRDGHECQICGKKDSTINAHHLYDYSSYPDLRHNVEDGVTMCRGCHRDFHVDFMGHWTVPCTPEDYARYLAERRIEPVAEAA